MRWGILVALQVLSCSQGVHPLLQWIPTPIKLTLLDMFSDLMPVIFNVQRAMKPVRDDSSERDEFDFIVVGAGAAGSALALRLTEQSDWNVLLLEAGEEEVSIMDIPFPIGMFQRTDSSWHLVSTPQTTSCVVMDESRCDYPVGRAIGGSTTMDHMLAIRGNSKDYDNWEAMGNQGWSFGDVLPYFRKVEAVNIPEFQDSDLRGKEGRIKISYAQYFSDVGRLIRRAAEEAGFPVTEDYNGAQQTGASRIQTTTFQDSRWSANAGYLRKARRRPNLFLRARSTVTRLILKGGRARGVRYVRGGLEAEAFATREVIVAAGAINSPAILMHSGIGPEDHLRELGIPLVQALPVGYNLMDHTVTIATFTTLNESVSPPIEDFVLNPLTFINYFLRKSGPLTRAGIFDMVSFHEFEGEEYNVPGWPDVEILYSSVNAMPTQKLSSVYRISEKAFNKDLKPLEGKDVIMGAIFRLRPKSRGRVYLLNNDTSTPPQIDPRGFSDPEDVEVVLAGVRDFQKILAAPSFQKVGAQMATTPVLGCEDLIFDSDDYWRCAIQQYSFPIYHPSGTCKMGPDGDPTAVVTPDLKVVGIEGLRVVDASIMPLIISGHLQLTCYMIGEKAADLIIKESQK